MAATISSNIRLVVKVNFEDDVRRFQLESTTAQELFDKIAEVYSLKKPLKHMVKYQDVDGDLVTIANDSDLQLAVKDLLQDDPLRLVLVRRKPRKAQLASTTPSEGKTTTEAATSSPSSSDPNTKEEKDDKWKEMKERKRKMKEEMREKKRKMREEFKKRLQEKGEGAEPNSEDKGARRRECLEMRRKMHCEFREMKRKMREECRKNGPCKHTNSDSNKHNLKTGDVITLLSHSDKQNRDNTQGWFVGINDKGELAANYGNGSNAQWVVEEVGRRAAVCLSSATNRDWHIRILDDGTVNGRGGTGRWARFVPEVDGDKICFRTIHRERFGGKTWYLGVSAEGALIAESSPNTKFTVTKAAATP